MRFDETAREILERRKPGRPVCECGGRLQCGARASRAKRWYRIRRRHDMCRRCYRAELDRLLAHRWLSGIGAQWPMAS
jgi:hypothetical protein